MRFLDKIYIMTVAICILAGCSAASFKVVVSNPYDYDRHPEMVEVALTEVCTALALADDEDFVIRSKRKEVPYQITHDGKIIFPVTLEAGGQQTYTFRKGTPAAVQAIACGKHYPDKDNDIAWENDKVGFRMYGHKLDVAAGYDLFAKRGTERPVLEEFYKNEVSTAPTWNRYKELLETDSKEAFRYLMDSISYHVDKGFGMDCYAVGPTLGAGVAALVEDGKIIYPYCYDTFEILDNGPLRFTFKTTFRPMNIGDDCVTETRIITLDAGSRLNRTSVSYTGLRQAKQIVAGIALRDNGLKSTTEAEKGYISYPAPTQNADTTQFVDNGILYVGHAYPAPLSETKEAEGHVLALSEYVPGTSFEYFWGFGWDHADILSSEQWNTYLEVFAAQIRNPLLIDKTPIFKHF